MESWSKLQWARAQGCVIPITFILEKLLTVRTGDTGTIPYRYRCTNRFNRGVALADSAPGFGNGSPMYFVNSWALGRSVIWGFVGTNFWLFQNQYYLILQFPNITQFYQNTQYYSIYWYYSILLISLNITDVTQYYSYYSILPILLNITNITC